MAAVAHVTAEPVGVAFLPQPDQQLFFDEAASCIHLVEGRMITAVALPQPPHGGAGRGVAPPHSSPLRSPQRSASPDPAGYESDSSAASTTARAFLVSEGPAVRLIRSSLDGAFTALHRSERLVEVHCHATGNMFVEAAGADKQGRKGCDPRLLGFFWTAAGFVMVTAAGLAVHSVHPSLQGLRLESTLPLQGVQWYTYSPLTHMVVLGFGSSGAKLQAIQFSKAGTLRLPLLDLTPPWGSPIRPLQAAALSAALEGFGAARAAPARLVGPDTCWVVVLYGRAFCAHHDRGAGLLRLYRMFRDATSLAHQYEVYAAQLELSVVDDVLLVHHIGSAVVMLVDIMAAGPAPLCSPLPLALTTHPTQEHGLARRSPSQAAEQLAAGPEAAPQAAEPPVPLGGGGGGGGGAPALQLHPPSWLVDGSSGVVYRLQLDLRSVADSQSDCLRLLAFLQRRRPSAAPRRDPAGITLRVLRGLLQDEAPLSLLRGAFDVVNSHGGGGAAASRRAGGVPRGVAGGGVTPPPASSPEPAEQPRLEVTPQDVYSAAFAVLRAQQAAPARYLQAALAEFVASCHAHGRQVAPPLATLYVDLLLDQGLPHLVAPLLLAHPLLDSPALAEHVARAEAADRLPGGAQLAEALLARLGAHEARCRLLLGQGRAREALLLARRHRLAARLGRDALLQAAASAGDASLFVAAHRVCVGHGLSGESPPLLEAAQPYCRHFQPAQLEVLQAGSAQ